MARYKEKPNPFITPQMTRGVQRALTSAVPHGEFQEVARAYSSVTKGKYEYSVVKQWKYVSFGGGPRVSLRVGITGGVKGAYPTTMEFGSVHYPLRARGMGKLRALAGG